MNVPREDVTRATAVLGFSLVVWLLSYSRLLADSEAAIRKLRAHKADVRWVTERGLVYGDAIPLRKEEYHYRVAIGEQWTGGNRGLAWLSDVARLKVLRIENAPGVDEDGLAQMGKLLDVEEFYLLRVDVSDEGLVCLHSMPRLRALGVQHVPITDDGLAGLAQLKNLESLDLFSLKQVGDKTVLALERQPRLRRLTLARTEVSDAGLQHLNRGLESLNLWETQVTDDGMKSLRPLRKLKALNLTGTRVSDQGLAHLARLPELESLSLGRTAVTEAGVTAFLKARGSRRQIRVVH